MDKQETTMILRRDELTKFLNERQDRLLDKMTDAFNRFRSSDNETFYEGYQECLKDVHDFFENKKGLIGMIEQEIVTYLKENKDNGVAFGFMPQYVKDWCLKHRFDRILYVFDDDAWIVPDSALLCYSGDIYCLPEEYELEAQFKPDWQEFDIDKDGFFSYNGKLYHYRDDGLFEKENFKKFKGFGGWLYVDSDKKPIWYTSPRVVVGGRVYPLASIDIESEPAVPTKIRFWRRKE